MDMQRATDSSSCIRQNINPFMRTYVTSVDRLWPNIYPDMASELVLPLHHTLHAWADGHAIIGAIDIAQPTERIQLDALDAR